MALAHPIAFQVGLAATLSLLAAGFLRLLAAGGVRALLSLILLVPGPLTYWIAMVRKDRVHEWYYLFALPGLVVLVALGLGWIFAWVRRPRLRAALTAAAMVVALGSYAVWTRLPRERAAKWLAPTPSGIRPADAGHSRSLRSRERQAIITTSFKRGPTYYDPLLIGSRRMPEMRKLMRRADRTGAALYVNLGKPEQAGQASPGPVRAGGEPLGLRGGDDALRVRAPGSSHHLPLSREGGRMSDARSARTTLCSIGGVWREVSSTRGAT